MNEFLCSMNLYRQHKFDTMLCTLKSMNISIIFKWIRIYWGKQTNRLKLYLFINTNFCFLLFAYIFTIFVNRIFIWQSIWRSFRFVCLFACPLAVIWQHNSSKHVDKFFKKEQLQRQIQFVKNPWGKTD